MSEPTAWSVRMSGGVHVVIDADTYAEAVAKFEAYCASHRLVPRGAVFHREHVRPEGHVA